MTSPRTTNHWVIVVLLLLSVCINYIDRGSLSVAAPLLKKEFALGPSQLGDLLSAFFWSYTACQLVVGWLVDRYDVKWVYAIGFFVWSLAMAATGLVNSFTALFAARLMLGIGESVFLPSVSKIVVRLFPPERRGLPNALVDVGTKIGPFLSTLIGGLLVERFGWRVLFLGVGLASLFWLVPWLILAPREPANREAHPRSTLGMWAILRRREAWGTSLGMFTLGYVWVFLLTWLPSYLVSERNYSIKQMAVFGSLPFLGMAVATLSGGWASDRWIALGGAPTSVRKSFASPCTRLRSVVRKLGTPTFVRKSFAIAGLLLCAGLLLPAALAQNASLSMGLLIASCVSLGLFTSNVWAITQTLAGPEAAGKWTGIQNFIGNLGGVISPIIAGLIVQQTGSFFLAFAAAAGILVLGAMSYLLLVPKVEPLVWSSTESTVRA